MQGLIGILLFAMVVMGIVLLVKGLKRRSEPAEPSCSECGYDLRGIRAPQGTGEGVRCPECGCELGYPGRIVRERTVRRWRLAAAGLASLLIGLSPGVVPAISSMLTGNPLRLTPAWVLDKGVRSNYGDRDSAEELARRIAAGTVSEARIRRLVDHGLEWQQRAAAGGTHLFPHRPFHADRRGAGEDLLWRGGHWPTVLEAALLHGHMSPQQVERFLGQGLLVEVYATRPGTVGVQVISLLGPTLSPMLEFDVRERSFELTRRQFTSHGSGHVVPTWWWSFALAEESEVHITWRIRAGRILEAIGREGDSLSGEFAAELPLDVEALPLLRQWRPLEASQDGEER